VALQLAEIVTQLVQSVGLRREPKRLQNGLVAPPLPLRTAPIDRLIRNTTEDLLQNPNNLDDYYLLGGCTATVSQGLPMPQRIGTSITRGRFARLQRRCPRRPEITSSKA
jgi:hypothetical protein